MSNLSNTKNPLKALLDGRSACPERSSGGAERPSAGAEWPSGQPEQASRWARCSAGGAETIATRTEQVAGQSGWLPAKPESLAAHNGKDAPQEDGIASLGETGAAIQESIALQAESLINKNSCLTYKN